MSSIQSRTKTGNSSLDNFNPETQPVPPGAHAFSTGHHWLMERNSEGHFLGPIVLQWQPGRKTWCKSGDIATGNDVDTRGWTYLEPIATPAVWTIQRAA